MIDRRKTLKTVSNPGIPSLILAWLILIIFPVFSFLLLLEFFLNASEENLRTEAVLEMINELENFREDLNCEVFLTNALNNFSRLHGFVNTGKSLKDVDYFNNLSAEKLKKKIENSLGIKTLALFYHGPDTKSISYSLASGREKEFLVSRTMLKTLFQILNQQHLKAVTSGKKNPYKPGLNDIEKKTERAVAFMKNLFQTVGEYRLEAGEVKTALSGKSDLNRIYFYYSAASKITDSGEANLGGFIVVIREADVPLKLLLKKAAEKSNYDGIRRSYSLLPYKDKKHFNSNQSLISNLIEKNDSIVLKSPMTMPIIRRLACNCSFYPKHIDKVIKNFPVIAISATKDRLQHPLRAYVPKIKTICLIVVIILSVILLKIYFAGFIIPFKIQVKILIAVCAAAALPFSALWVLSLYHENFRNEFQKNEIVQYLNQHFEEFAITLSSFRTSLEYKNVELESKLEQLEDYELIPYLKSWIKNTPVTSINSRINHVDGLTKASPDVRLSTFEMEMKEFLFTSVENAFSKIKADGTKNTGEIGLIKYKVKGIGTFLSDIGLIHNSAFTNLDALYTLLTEFNRIDPSLGVNRVFLLKFTTKQILNSFLKLDSRFIENETRAGFKIRKCIIPLENAAELPPRSDFICGKDFPIEEILEKARKILANKSEGTWSFMINGNMRIIKANYVHSMQSIFLSVADQIQPDQFTVLPSPIYVSLYFVAVIFVLIVILGSFFVLPVKLLQAVTDEIGKGNFKQKICLNSGDEFEELANAFNGMANQLLQKEKLASFVSEDVLEEVSTNKETVLLPGGERCEVSVVFCSLPGLKNFSPKNEAEKIIKVLGTLIDKADMISRQNNGVIDKIIDDTVMIVFRKFDSDNGHVISACKAALQLSDAFPSKDCSLNVACGIASGAAVSGKIGSREGKLDYTVIGNPVNLAARLKAQAHLADQTGILLCPQTIRMTRGLARLRFIERIEIKGRTRTFPMYELLALREVSK
ncbi:MAG: hypothetical protein Kow0029_05440 [Candidatus Rifleibacteriota bacterium]